MMLIVKLGDRFSQRLDTRSGTVLAAMARDIHLLGALKAALDLVVDLGCALAQIGPALGVLQVAVLIGPLRRPDDTGRGAGGVETGMRLVALVGAELAMDFGGEFWRNMSVRNVGVGGWLIGGTERGAEQGSEVRVVSEQ